MLDKKDLQVLESMFDRKFLEIEDRLDKKIDEKMDAKFEAFETKIYSVINAKFEAFETKIYSVMNTKLEDFKKQFSLELSDVLQDIISTIDSRFSKMEEKLNNRLAVQDKKIDLLLEYSKDNIQKHDVYDSNFSRINSKLLNHDLRLNSLESNSTILV